MEQRDEMFRQARREKELEEARIARDFDEVPATPNISKVQVNGELVEIDLFEGEVARVPREKDSDVRVAQSKESRET